MKYIDDSKIKLTLLFIVFQPSIRVFKIKKCILPIEVNQYVANHSGLHKISF